MLPRVSTLKPYAQINARNFDPIRTHPHLEHALRGYGSRISGPHGCRADLTVARGVVNVSARTPARSARVSSKIRGNGARFCGESIYRIRNALVVLRAGQSLWGFDSTGLLPWRSLRAACVSQGGFVCVLAKLFGGQTLRQAEAIQLANACPLMLYPYCHAPYTYLIVRARVCRALFPFLGVRRNSLFMCFLLFVPCSCNI